MAEPNHLNATARISNVRNLLGSVAIFAPLLVIAAWWVTEHSTAGNALNAYMGMFLAAFLYVVTAIALGAGFVCAVIGVILGKGSRALPILGIVLNVVATLWIVRGMK